MSTDAQIQIVAVMPGSGFESIGLVDPKNLDILMSCMATLDTRGGRTVSVIDILHAFERAKAQQAQRRSHGNNDAAADGA